MERVAQHLAAYHSHWGKAEAARIVAAYPRNEFKTGNMQIVRAGTDFCFICSTRKAARALAAAGVETFLYSFEYEFAGEMLPGSRWAAVLCVPVGRSRCSEVCIVSWCFVGFTSPYDTLIYPMQNAIPQWRLYRLQGPRIDALRTGR
uniref:Uncharacterized protein n=1 Tax=Haptolina brevifila TaxID=156173 RepID=A0A7S2IMR3_9EUKA